ncbi:hypothetical protein V6N13_143872 [Hibiscus sabdariffa]|uniref:Uncharacterized protein n=1 Tax=Hibiscus sabdariffa TaxID=183260 RepID=A0ABR2FIQ8_9ROSI
MREALGRAPKRSYQPQGSCLGKHELSEVVKRGSTAEGLVVGHAEAAQVDSLCFSRMPRPWEDPSTLPSTQKVEELVPSTINAEEGESDYESSRKRQRREEKRQEKHDRHEKRREKHEKHHGKHERHEKLYSRDTDDKRSRKKEKEKSMNLFRIEHLQEHICIL